MKWEVKTFKKTHLIKSNSSGDAVRQVRNIDDSELLSVRLVPKTLTGKVKKIFKQIFKS
jgi:hypothetical protein